MAHLIPLIRVHLVLCAVESSGKNNSVKATMLMEAVIIANNFLKTKLNGNSQTRLV